MSLTDFLFPEQSQAAHLRTIAEASKDISRYQASRDAAEISNEWKINGLNRRINKLETDLATLSMINALLIRKYIADTGCTLERLQADMAEVDRSDGVVNGGLNTDELRRILGLKVADSTASVPKSDRCHDCNRVLAKNLTHCMYCGCPKS